VPLALTLCVAATYELLGFFRASGITPRASVVRLAVLLPVLAACAPIMTNAYNLDEPLSQLGWLAGGLATGLLVALVGEMARYEKPGETIPNLAATSFAILYVGGLLGFLIQLRLLPVAGNVSRGGLLALLSMIIVVKMTDIGAYTVGRLFGRHKLAPILSPGKTWEGALGGLAFGVVGAIVALGPLADALQVVRSHNEAPRLAATIAYGLIVGTAGILGDLAESLLKRDAGVKDSSTWLPGFGGVLDLLDSLLVAAPVAYFCWASGLLGS